jgi:hypothetical protein
VPANGDADAALLARQLVTGGFQLYHVSLEKPSLEQIFLQLTTAGTNPVHGGAK